MITAFRDITFCREPNGTRSVLGAGASGFVYRASWCGEDVAIKSILWPSRVALRALAHEAAVQSSLRHNAVLAIHGIAINEEADEEDAEEDRKGPKEAVLIIELMEGGGSQLAVWIGAGDAAPPLATRLKALSDIARALRFAHARGIAHGDVSPQNALSDESSVWGGARLIDWGAASRCNNNNNNSFEHVAPTRADKGDAKDSMPWRVGESAVDVAADAFADFFGRGREERGGGRGREESRFSAAPAYADPSGPNLVSPEGDIFAFALTAWELLTCTDSNLDAAQLLAGHRPDINALPRGASLLAPLLVRAWSACVSDRPSAAEVAAALSRAALAATVAVTAAEFAATVRIFRRGGDAEDDVFDADVTTETIATNMTPMGGGGGGGGAWTPARPAQTPVKITPVKAATELHYQRCYRVVSTLLLLQHALSHRALYLLPKMHMLQQC